MILTVPYSEFLETAKRFDIGEVFVEPAEKGVVLTGLLPNRDHVLRAWTEEDRTAVERELTPLGFLVLTGEWTRDAVSPDHTLDRCWVAAVAYVSDKKMPGIWVDAFDAEPTPAQVLKAVYDEFLATGELNEVSMEEFVRLAEPNVVIVTPSSLKSFLEAKGKEPD